eukprot:11746092-Alexandrium_andersonii.AAC.1
MSSRQNSRRSARPNGRSLQLAPRLNSRSLRGGGVHLEPLLVGLVEAVPEALGGDVHALALHFVLLW